MPVDDRVDRCPVTEWGKGTDGIAGDREHRSGVCQAYSSSAYFHMMPDGLAIDKLRPPSDHQERFAVDQEEQRLDDLVRRRTNGLGGQIDSRRVDRKGYDLCLDPMGPDEFFEIRCAKHRASM